MNEEIHIKSLALRKFLLKYYDVDNDGKLSLSDLEKIRFLEITTPKMQLWDETPEISLVTRGFSHAEDLDKMSNLECLVISAQPIFRLELRQKSLKEVHVIQCPLDRIIAGGETAFKEYGDTQIDWFSPDLPLDR